MTDTLHPAASDPAWTTWHRLYREALSSQSPKLRGLLSRAVGPNRKGFLDALLDGLLRITSEIDEQGDVWYHLQVAVIDGYASLARVHITQLLSGDDLATTIAGEREFHRSRNLTIAALVPDDTASLDEL